MSRGGLDDMLSTLTLLQVHDSAFPTGAFAFSHGMETLVGEGRVAGPAAVRELLAGQALRRWLEFDRWFLGQAYESADDPAGVQAVDWSCEAHNVVAALAEASRRIGQATLVTHARLKTTGAEEFRVRVRDGSTPGHAPVVQGVIAAALGLDRAKAELGALYATMSAATSAAVRLGVLGALDAQTVLAGLRDPIVQGLSESPPDSPATFAPIIDIAAMRHAASETRLFGA